MQRKSGARGQLDSGTLIISWTPLERARRLASALGGVYFVPGGRRDSRPAAVRYILQSLRTIAAVRRRRPRTVVYTNPPFLTGVLLAALRKWHAFSLWSDLHEGSFGDPRWVRFAQISNWVLTQGDGVIVANPRLVAGITRKGLRSCTVGMPAAVDRGPRAESQGYLVATVSYSFDEPVAELMTAAAGVPEATVILTGRPPREIVEAAPANVQFTGWLEREDYESLLAKSSGVICLTNLDQTMQMGAYEGAEHGVPLLLSDRQVLREYFPDGALFLRDHEPATIAAGLRTLTAESGALRSGAERMRRQLLQRSASEIANLLYLLERP